MGSERRNIISLKFKVPIVDNLIALKCKLTAIGEKAFFRDYGKISGLLVIKVNVGALVSLPQLYDPSL